MPLLNYTTEVPASKSIAEITRILQEGGADSITLENGPDREVVGVSFTIATEQFGRVHYTLPANVAAVILRINATIKEEAAKVGRVRGFKRKVPTSLFNNKEQAERIAWRIAKDWLEAQLAINAIGSAKLEQVMLPFANVNGVNFYQLMIERGTLALPAPKTERPVTEIEVQTS